ncbi:MAG: endonuclease Q family protein [Acetobacteraceae bacterium]|nr:endonuclease Q family protein [Acetobacteraceae bacterium]
MNALYADLHVHLGSTQRGRPVKMGASRGFTLRRAAEAAAGEKGLDLLGVVDLGVPEVLAEAEDAVRSGEAEALGGGGLRLWGRVTVIPGAEVELPLGRGIAHILCLFPGLRETARFGAWLGPRVRNPSLSTQRLSATAPADLARAVCALDGLLIPAHAFTPHKSLFGACVERLAQAFPGSEPVSALELGLSADTAMADRLSELRDLSFVTNSDAHSAASLGREYNLLQAAEPSFRELAWALARSRGRRVAANFGLDPRLGKYHRTSCRACGRIAEAPPPQLRCPHCGSRRVVVGVRDRLETIADLPEPASPPHRPPYLHQVPLRFLPGLGPAALSRLLEAFGSEMAVLHRASAEDLERAVGPRLASLVVAAREGRLTLSDGGGGRYGRVLSP